MSMLYNLVTIASSAEGEGASAGLLDSLGIDWKMLVLQSVAFLLLLFLLSKYVYPVLLKSIDKREKLIEESVSAAHDAEKNAREAEAKIAKLMKDARKQADEMVSSAKTESAQLVEAADKKSRERAERIAADAQEQISKDVASARKALRKETLDLVVEATEKVVGKTINASVDQKVVASAVDEVKN